MSIYTLIKLNKNLKCDNSTLYLPYEIAYEPKQCIMRKTWCT